MVFVKYAKNKHLGVTSHILRRILRIGRKGIRRPMISKRGNKNFYKGYGAQSFGYHTSKGKYMIIQSKIPKYSLSGIYKPINKLELPTFYPKLDLLPTKSPVDIIVKSVNSFAGNLLSGLKNSIIKKKN